MTKTDVKDKNLDGIVTLKDETGNDIIAILIGAIKEINDKMDKLEEKMKQLPQVQVIDLAEKLLLLEEKEKLISEEFKVFIEEFDKKKN